MLYHLQFATFKCEFKIDFSGAGGSSSGGTGMSAGGVQAEIDYALLAQQLQTQAVGGGGAGRRASGAAISGGERRSIDSLSQSRQRQMSTSIDNLTANSVVIGPTSARGRYASGSLVGGSAFNVSQPSATPLYQPRKKMSSSSNHYSTRYNQWW